jgi:glycosyltransferase involved in cell wall biosynthesis
MEQFFLIRDFIAHFRKSDIAIFHDFAPPPTGGGHQFMRALQRYFMDSGFIVEVNTLTPTARACLFNSFNFNFKRLRKIKEKRPVCKMIHRVDGPISVYRGFDDGTDRITLAWNNELADVTIFQSRYSLEAYNRLGYSYKRPHIIIPNSPDPDIFNRQGKIDITPERKIRLISTSWSDNPNKGLETYKWLDKNLDWTRYEYTFIGRIKAEFLNIKHIKPIDSSKIADHLKNSDIYITASRHDPCSNSLLEALACGLPSLYLDSGGHAELVQQAGMAFDSPDQIPDILELIIKDYEKFRSNITIPSISEIAQRYLKVMEISHE